MFFMKWVAHIWSCLLFFLIQFWEHEECLWQVQQNHRQHPTASKWQSHSCTYWCNKLGVELRNKNQKTQRNCIRLPRGILTSDYDRMPSLVTNTWYTRARNESSLRWRWWCNICVICCWKKDWCKYFLSFWSVISIKGIRCRV